MLSNASAAPVGFLSSEPTFESRPMSGCPAKLGGYDPGVEATTSPTSHPAHSSPHPAQFHSLPDSPPPPLPRQALPVAGAAGAPAGCFHCTGASPSGGTSYFPGAVNVVYSMFTTAGPARCSCCRRQIPQDRALSLKSYFTHSSYFTHLD